MEAAQRYLAAVARHDQVAAQSVVEPKFRGRPFALDPHALGYSGRVEATAALFVPRNIWTVGTSVVKSGARSPGPTISVVRARSGNYFVAGYVVHG